MRRIAALILAFAVIPAAQGAAGGIAAGQFASRMALFKAQMRLIDRRAAVQYKNSDRLLPKPNFASFAHVGVRYRGKFLAMARVAARKYRVPTGLFVRLVEQESGWNPHATSHKGAIGLAQLMPDTARRLGVNPRDPRANLDGGARYLRRQYERFHSWRLALAAYNAGPDAVAQYKGVPPFRETQNYVLSILGKS